MNDSESFEPFNSQHGNRGHSGSTALLKYQVVKHGSPPKPHTGHGCIRGTAGIRPYESGQDPDW
jgi:hypothetical protein